MGLRVARAGLLLGLIVATGPRLLSSCFAADSARNEAIAILAEIQQLCESQGAPGCASRIRGADRLFEVLRIDAELQRVEREFVEFVRRRYGQPDFQMKSMAAHLALRLNTELNPAAVDVESAVAVPGGYEVVTPKDARIRLFREGSTWVSRVPKPTAEQMKPFEKFAQAATLKRAILQYRRLEAEMADLDLESFARRFVQELTPLVVAYLQREDLVAQMPDWKSRLAEVSAFYRPLTTLEDMKADIRRRWRLTGM